jgi:hypothetical protein
VPEENTHQEAWGTPSRADGEKGSASAGDPDTSTVPIGHKGAAGGYADTRTVPLAFHEANPGELKADGSQTTRNHVALPVGYALHEYTLEAVLGSGGFGITYLARDNNLQRQVAIKEYLPNDLAVRTSGQVVCAKTESDTHGYRIGLDGFLAEARVLAGFRHPNIVRVTRFFEANNTAYMVMDYEKGKPLRDWLQQHGPVDEALLLRMFLPLLEGLDVVHKARVLHRDIKPANIYVREEDGSLVLLDFGAARYARSDDSRSLTSIVTPGFAPLEQYHTHGAQGPWSDLYALGGVLYWVVTGEKPLEAPSRVKSDAMPSALSLAKGRYSERVLRAIDWALTPDEADRPKSVSQLRAVLTGEVAAPPPPISAASAGKQGAAGAQPAGRLPLLLGAAGVAVLAIAALVFFPRAEKPAPAPVQPQAAEQVPPAAAAAPAPAETKKPTAAAETKPAREASAGSKPVAAEKKKEAAAAPTATVILDVHPQGEIVLDGRAAGTSPPLTRLVVSAGVKHKIEIRGDGLPHYWTVELQPGEQREISANFTRRY